MKNTPEILATIKERYHLADLQEVPFDPNAKRAVELNAEWLSFFPVPEWIYLLDEHGGKIAVVKDEETVRESLDKLTDDYKKDVVCLWFQERKQVAFVPENT